MFSFQKYPSRFSDSNTGFVGGGYLGYKFQVSPSFLIGVEADANWNSGDATSVIPNSPVGGEQYTVSQDWDASIRGRIGYHTSQALLYLTGGVALTNFETYDTPRSGGTDSNSRTGWNIAVGGEYMFTPNVIGRLQYLYADFATSDYFHTLASTVDDRTHKIQVGMGCLFNGP